VRIENLLGSAALAVVASGLLASSAFANPVIFTAVGTIDSGIDQLNEWGTGGDLAGYSFKAVYTFIPDASKTHTIGTAERYEESLGLPSIGSLDLTINGVTEHYDGNYEAREYKLRSNTSNELSAVVADAIGDPVGCAGSCTVESAYSKIFNSIGQVYGPGLSLSLPGSFFGIETEFFWQHYQYIRDDDYFPFESFASGRVANITISGNGGGAPEPAIWGLMLFGFGSVGAALRRRRALAGIPLGDCRGALV
jgi:hypothetical protein